MLVLRDVAEPGEDPEWRQVSQRLVGGPKVSLRLPSTPLRLRVEAEGYERTHVDLPRPDEDGEIVVVLSAASGG